MLLNFKQVLLTQKPNDSILQYAARLSDQEWLEVVEKSVEHRFVDGIELPGFPPDEIQRNSVGSSGKLALGEGFRFYSEIKRYAASLESTTNQGQSHS